MEQLYDLIILGSGCAGLTAGIYAGRAQLRTLILESGAVGGRRPPPMKLEIIPECRTRTGRS